jgi:hypothetical protein
MEQLAEQAAALNTMQHQVAALQQALEAQTPHQARYKAANSAPFTGEPSSIMSWTTIVTTHLRLNNVTDPVGHTSLCIVDWSKTLIQNHAYDNMNDRQLSRIEFSYITD